MQKIYFDSRQTDLICKTYGAYSTIFRHKNAEYQKDIAETCLDSKTSKKATIYRILYHQSSKYYFSIEAYNPFTSIKSS